MRRLWERCLQGWGDQGSCGSASTRSLQQINSDLEAALAHQRATALAGFRGSPIALHTMAVDGTILDVSDRWLKLLGYSREQAEQEAVRQSWNRISIYSTPDLIQRDVDGLRAEQDVVDRPRILMRRDGTMLEVEVSKRLEQGDDGEEYVVVALVDNSARRAAETALRESEGRLRQAQKMEIIGQMAGGVAHDFNNLLQVVHGALQMIRKRLDEGDTVDRRWLSSKISLANHGCNHAARLTAQLMAFARRQNLEPRVFEPAKVLEEERGPIATTLGPRVELRWDIAADIGLCRADPGQLADAILNLATNARDAIEPRGRGIVTVSVRRRRLEGQGVDAPVAGDYISISVTDDGVGMSPDTLARAIEPFFTTKGVGKGTGLGLASVHGFARQSGGTVMIESEIGRGSTVSILLPRVTAEQVANEALAEAAMPAGSGETILIAEDNDLVREVLAEQLRDLNYQVIEAPDADQAFQVLRNSEVRIDALLTDMVMPGSIDGLQLCDRVRMMWPSMPVALLTGNMDAIRWSGMPSGTRYLPKPYKGSALAIMLREMLESEPSLA